MEKELEYMTSEFEKEFGSYEFHESENTTSDYELLFKGFLKGYETAKLFIKE